MFRAGLSPVGKINTVLTHGQAFLGVWRDFFYFLEKIKKKPRKLFRFFTHFNQHIYVYIKFFIIFNLSFLL
jgi:hypothetical protein